MHEVRPIALLKATGQSRFLKVVAVCAASGLVLVSLAPVAAARDADSFALVVFLIGAILLLLPAWIALRKIKCPNCGTHWLQHALGGRPMGDWAGWLFTFTECPECKATSALISAAPPPSNKSFERTREG
jgi:hypothetical protein